MDLKYKDQNLKIPGQLYGWVCIPVRLTISLLFIFGIVPEKLNWLIALAYILVSIGLGYKYSISGNSWKCYPRAIVIYMAVAMLLLTNNYYKIKNLNTAVGVLLFIDAMMGVQSRYTFNRLGKN